MTERMDEALRYRDMVSKKLVVWSGEEDEIPRRAWCVLMWSIRMLQDAARHTHKPGNKLRHEGG